MLGWEAVVVSNPLYLVRPDPRTRRMEFVQIDELFLAFYPTAAKSNLDAG